MAVWVDFIFLSLFDDHPFVTEEGGNFNRFIMSLLNVLQGISFLQSFQIIVITGNTDVCKSCVQSCPMHALGNFLVRIKRLFCRSSDFSSPGADKNPTVQVRLHRLYGKQTVQIPCHGYEWLRPHLLSCPSCPLLPA